MAEGNFFDINFNSESDGEFEGFNPKNSAIVMLMWLFSK